MASAWTDIYGAMKRGSTPTRRDLGYAANIPIKRDLGYAANLSTPKSASTGGGVGGSSVVSQPVVQQQPQVQQQQQQFNYPSFQPTPWTPPQLPQEPQVSSQMIADWIARAKTEAGLQFDPQLLSIQQEFEKMMLGAEQAKGGLDQPYQDIIDYVKNWQKEETGATQRRAYARGFGRGGGLVEEEGKIAERGLKEITAAGTERARKLGDIEEQKLLLMEQTGAKKTDIETQRGRYVAARSSDLEDSYKQNKRQLEQQRFANQMQISQVGMTKEANDFNRWLGTMSLANETWYREQTLGLERESMALSENARKEAQLWKESQAGTAGETTDPYENMFKLPGGGWISNEKALQYGLIPSPGTTVETPKESDWEKLIGGLSEEETLRQINIGRIQAGQPAIVKDPNVGGFTLPKGYVPQPTYTSDWLK